MKWFILSVLALALVSCTPDPRNQADADVTRLLAEQNAADREQARAQDAQRFDLDQSQRESVSGQWVLSVTELIFWGMKALTVASVVALLGAGMGIAWVSVGSARAISQSAWIRANSIALDAATGQYPLIISRVGKGQFMLTDPNTGMTLQLFSRNAPDRQMIAAAFAGRLNAATAYQARMAGPNAEGVSVLGTSPIVVTGGNDG